MILMVRDASVKVWVGVVLVGNVTHIPLSHILSASNDGLSATVVVVHNWNIQEQQNYYRHNINPFNLIDHAQYCN